MFEGVDTVVLYNELAFQDVLPVEWKALTQPLDRFELLGLEEANVLLLQACVAIDEHPPREKNEELGPLAGEIARIDVKLNLVLQMLGRLVARRDPPAPSTISFNALGASWTHIGTPPAIGEHGLLRIQLRRGLPQSLEMPAEIAAVEGSTVKVKFPDLSESVAELIQRLAFLRHRRQVADVRKSRG